MTGRTHDLAAFTALSYVVATHQVENITLGTLFVAFTANLIGGLTPDIDQPTADLWRRIPAGSIWGRLLSPILGGHRLLSHSIVGIFLFGIGVKYLLYLMKSVLIVDMNMIWWAFMIGFVSHLVADTFTREGVPWLFPIPIKLGIPPFKFMRMKTSGVIEKFVVFPGLIFANGYIYYSHYSKFINLLRHHIR
jgi:inner membrane protein